MSDDGRLMSVPPFPDGYRASGVLLHVTSLPSPYGIGDVGPSAFSWIDRLHDAGQSWWQALPLGPTGYGNSPYQSLSSFAGNGLLISPQSLIADDLLRASEIPSHSFSASSVDYDVVIPFKHQLLETAWTNFKRGARPDLQVAFDEFRHAQAHWLEDYALFRALKMKHNGAYYLEWPPELLQRVPAALAQTRRELSERIEQVCLAQFLLFRQGERLKDYAHARGVRLMGDLPFFVSPDSSDVWANPELFLLDDHYRPRFVAGVPPDYFSAQGQLWGNPVYNWDALRRTGYRWCIDRLRTLLAHVDAIRLDHFRAFAAAWHVPAGARTARAGLWVPGPGADFFSAVQEELSTLPLIAEDLGVITPDVRSLRDQFQIPGMRVLQFAFDGRADNPHLPDNYVGNSVVYTGTHDNNTTRGWFEELPDEAQQRVWAYLKRRASDGREVAPALLELAWSSAAALAMTPLQDLLNLGSIARMNVPGRADGNWRWRCTEDMPSAPAFEQLRNLTKMSNRWRLTPQKRPFNERADPSLPRTQGGRTMTLFEQQLQKMRTQPGFIAALDQSGGSTPKALRSYGIKEDAWSNEAEMFAIVHRMRTRIITSPSFTGERILGAILFENTMDQEIQGQPSADYLWNVKRVVPFLKVDQGLAEEKNGAHLMKPMPGLAALLQKAKANRIFGTKMRSVVNQANAAGITEVVNQQFEAARQIIAAGFVPIIEPEVDIHCPEKAKAEALLKTALLQKLNGLPTEQLVMLKITLPEQDDFYAECVSHPNVVKVVALSGGYTREECINRLRRNHGVVASFSRALVEGLSAQQSDAAYNALLDAFIQSIFEASNT
jgi:4-alpha-glucanotransferase